VFYVVLQRLVERRQASLPEPSVRKAPEESVHA
jgi:hypothetical protein